MNLGQAIEKAVGGQDAKLAGKCANFMRFRMGMNYPQVVARVQLQCPEVTENDWESLMYESDQEELTSTP